MSLPFTLTSTVDAFYLAELFLGEDELAALVVDGRIALPVSGEVPPDGILAWDALLLDGLGDVDDRLLLASRRVTGPPFVLEDELDRWRTMQARHCNRELALVDWFVFVRDECVLSLAEIAGPAVAWS